MTSSSHRLKECMRSFRESEHENAARPGVVSRFQPRRGPEKCAGWLILHWLKKITKKPASMSFGSILLSSNTIK